MLDVLTASAAEPALVVTPVDFRDPMGEKSAPVATFRYVGVYREVSTRLLLRKIHGYLLYYFNFIRRNNLKLTRFLHQPA